MESRQYRGRQSEGYSASVDERASLALTGLVLSMRDTAKFTNTEMVSSLYIHGSGDLSRTNKETWAGVNKEQRLASLENSGSSIALAQLFYSPMGPREASDCAKVRWLSLHGAWAALHQQLGSDQVCHSCACCYFIWPRLSRKLELLTPAQRSGLLVTLWFPPRPIVSWAQASLIGFFSLTRQALRLVHVTALGWGSSSIRNAWKYVCQFCYTRLMDPVPWACGHCEATCYMGEKRYWCGIRTIYKFIGNTGIYPSASCLLPRMHVLANPDVFDKGGSSELRGNPSPSVTHIQQSSQQIITDSNVVFFLSPTLSVIITTIILFTNSDISSKFLCIF